ncbi:uncharacterized protein LOC124272093 isoform X2 [Haliotis rubra]|uniref:uncharacterized protein LOC124272093 isoform X2 n=1 Tax=Haliotis rubra TaxID=36100 RepID=UPI001EE4F4AB|nr:uncharacterized protein LOC124272093 isoform X2 [Haliotis rubra]
MEMTLQKRIKVRMGRTCIFICTWMTIMAGIEVMTTISTISRTTVTTTITMRAMKTVRKVMLIMTATKVTIIMIATKVTIIMIATKVTIIMMATKVMVITEDVEGENMTNTYMDAVTWTCAMNPSSPAPRNNITGAIYLRQKFHGPLEILLHLRGFYLPSDHSDHSVHMHGFHVHEFGDFSNGCTSSSGHFNPSGAAHGGHDAKTRHAGDWGNISCDDAGEVHTNMTDRYCDLYGPRSIIGRGLVIHETADHLGQAPVGKKDGRTRRIWKRMLYHCQDWQGRLGHAPSTQALKGEDIGPLLTDLGPGIRFLEVICEIIATQRY